MKPTDICSPAFSLVERRSCTRGAVASRDASQKSPRSVSLLLSETDRGLFCEASLDATAPRVQDLRSTSENAGLQMSVGFICSEDHWTEDRSRRELIQASVHRGDVTVCNYG